MPEDLMELDSATEETAVLADGEQVAEGAEGQQATEGEEQPVTDLFEPDGKKVHSAIRAQLAKIKTEKPDAGKLITDAVYRFAEFKREFPGGLAEARELRDKIEEYGGVDAISGEIATAKEFRELAKAFETSDPAFVDDMVESNPDAFASIAPMVFQKYAELNPDGFAGYVGRVVYADLQRNNVPLLMERLADVLPPDNTKAIEIFNTLNGYLGNFKTLADKAPTVKAGKRTEPAKDDNLKQREEALRSREWKTERDGILRTEKDGAMLKALAGRKPDTEEKAQIEELFMVRAKAAVDRLEPGWAEKAKRFIGNNDKAGYLRYIKSIYQRAIPEAIASAVNSTLRGKKAAPVNNQQNGVKKSPNDATQPAGFIPLAKEPETYQIDYSRTTATMITNNQAVMKDGKKVSWRG